MTQVDMDLLATGLQAGGFETELVGEAEGIDLPTLIVPIPGAPENRFVTVSALPGDGTGLEDLDAIQFYSPIETEAENERLGPLLALLAQINTMLPIGAFCMVLGAPIVHLRYVLLTPAGTPMTQAGLLETMGLFIYEIGTYEDVIVEVGNGSRSLNDALLLIDA